MALTDRVFGTPELSIKQILLTHKISYIARLVWLYAYACTLAANKIPESDAIAADMRLGITDITAAFVELTQTGKLILTQNGYKLVHKAEEPKGQLRLKLDIGRPKHSNPVLTLLRAFDASYARFRKDKRRPDRVDYRIARGLVRKYTLESVLNSLEEYFKHTNYATASLDGLQRYLRPQKHTHKKL